MASPLKNSGKNISGFDSTVAHSSKPSIYCVSDRLTTSEDDWLRQQKKLVNESYQSDRLERSAKKRSVTQ